MEAPNIYGVDINFVDEQDLGGQIVTLQNSLSGEFNSQVISPGGSGGDDPIFFDWDEGTATISLGTGDLENYQVLSYSGSPDGLLGPNAFHQVVYLTDYTDPIIEFDLSLPDFTDDVGAQMLMFVMGKVVDGQINPTDNAISAIQMQRVKYSEEGSSGLGFVASVRANANNTISPHLVQGDLNSLVASDLEEGRVVRIKMSSNIADAKLVDGQDVDDIVGYMNSPLLSLPSGIDGFALVVISGVGSFGNFGNGPIPSCMNMNIKLRSISEISE